MDSRQLLARFRTNSGTSGVGLPHCSSCRVAKDRDILAFTLQPDDDR